MTSPYTYVQYNLGLYYGADQYIRVIWMNIEEANPGINYAGWCFDYLGTNSFGPVYHIIAYWNNNNCLTWNESLDLDDLVSCADDAVASEWEVIPGDSLPTTSWIQIYNAYFSKGNACLRGDVSGDVSYVATCANIEEQWWTMEAEK